MRIIIFPVIILILSANLSVGQPPSENNSKQASLYANRPSVILVEGKVREVEESDRIVVDGVDGTVYTISLLGADAPDEKQDFHKKAKKRLAELIEGRDVKAVVRKDEAGRYIANVYFEGQDIGLRLIQEGLAWHFTKHSGAQTVIEREKYSDAEAAARYSRVGLWEDKNPMAPWVFRGEKPLTSNKDIPLPAATVDSPVNASPVPADVSISPNESKPGRTYILGPRGGCYYLNDKGHKVYVKDKSLCVKQ